MIRELIKRNRSYRRFDSTVAISEQQMKDWIDLARLSGSARNGQPLKYAIAVDKNTCEEIFPLIGWAAYLTEWKGPEEGERPVAYIAVLKDKNIADKHYCDDGIAMQSILLGATEDGFGGCMLGSINRKKLGEILGVPDYFEILWLIALGKPIEEVVIETANDDIKYWRDENEVHHIPKRALHKIIIPKKL